VGAMAIVELKEGGGELFGGSRAQASLCYTTSCKSRTRNKEWRKKNSVSGNTLAGISGPCDESIRRERVAGRGSLYFRGVEGGVFLPHCFREKKRVSWWEGQRRGEKGLSSSVRILWERGGSAEEKGPVPKLQHIRVGC